MARKQFDSVVNKTHRPSSSKRWMKYGHCGTVDPLYTITWSETRGHSHGKLCDAAGHEFGFICPLFGSVRLDFDPCYEILRLVGVTEKNGHPI
jgi:hypothetical protein